MIKIKLNELSRAISALSQIKSDLLSDKKVVYQAARILRHCDNEEQLFNSEKEKIIKKFSNGKQKFSTDKQQLLADFPDEQSGIEATIAINDLGKVEIEINLEPIKLSQLIDAEGKEIYINHAHLSILLDTFIIDDITDSKQSVKKNVK